MSLKTVIFDAAPSQRRVDENGFMHVDSCHITKEQVVKYYGREIPGWRELGLDPERLYNVYRPGDEIEKAAATFDGLPLQLQHHIDSADEPQTEFRVGSISRPVWRAPYLDCDLHITNGAAISAVEHGDFKEISAAYLYEPVVESGEFEGKPYEIVMRNLRGNHVALVREGRAGPDVVVADAKPCSSFMEWAKQKGFAFDEEEHWVTSNEGQKILINGEGEIKAGLGGKYNGENISSLPHKPDNRSFKDISSSAKENAIKGLKDIIKNQADEEKAEHLKWAMKLQESGELDKAISSEAQKELTAEELKNAPDDAIKRFDATSKIFTRLASKEDPQFLHTWHGGHGEPGVFRVCGDLLNNSDISSADKQAIVNKINDYFQSANQAGQILGAAYLSSMTPSEEDYRNMFDDAIKPTAWGSSDFEQIMESGARSSAYKNITDGVLKKQDELLSTIRGILSKPQKEADGSDRRGVVVKGPGKYEFYRAGGAGADALKSHSNAVYFAANKQMAENFNGQSDTHEVHKYSVELKNPFIVSTVGINSADAAVQRWKAVFPDKPVPAFGGKDSTSSKDKMTWTQMDRLVETELKNRGYDSFVVEQANFREIGVIGKNLGTKAGAKRVQALDSRKAFMRWYLNRCAQDAPPLRSFAAWMRKNPLSLKDAPSPEWEATRNALDNN